MRGMPRSSSSDTTAKPNRSGAATRAKIIDAAIAVLVEKGFAGFTLQAVADGAGIFYGNVTHHYATRDKLVEAMLEAILERYRTRFDELPGSLEAHDAGPVRALVTWLIDDSMSPETAPLFLELWAMATHMPRVAEGLTQLYDGAVDVCMVSLGVDPRAQGAKGLRDALFLLGTVIEGTSCIFYNRDRGDGIYDGFRREAAGALVPLIEQRLAEAKSAVNG
jgi:AcrR family transcriptional regulator